MSDREIRALERQWKAEPDNEEIAYKLMAAKARIDVNYAAWMQFLSGHWTLDAPTKPGSYTISTKGGSIVTPSVLLYYDGNAELCAHRLLSGLGEKTPSEIWGGYWWSEPSPGMPDIPVDEGSNGSESSDPALRGYCGNPDCGVSSGICGATTFGSGVLDDNGYWEHPCVICAAASLKNWPISEIDGTDMGVWPNPNGNP